MIKLFISLFVLQRGTLKARFLLKATVLRLRGGKRPCNLWRLLNFSEEFTTYLESFIISPEPLLIAGDFEIHFVVPSDIKHTVIFRELL